MTSIPIRGANALASMCASPVLRDYQTRGIEALRDLLRQGCRRLILNAPCGAGKGTIAAAMIHSATTRDKAVLFLVNRRTLVHDMSRRLDRLGIDHGVIMANHPRRKPWLRVHVASIDTLHRMSTLPHADLIFIDECHFSMAPTFRKVIDRFSNTPIIGMSATPALSTGEGLGTIYQQIVPLITDSELVDLGFLVPVRVYAPSRPDLKGVKIQQGDYNQKQLAEVCDKRRLIGDIVEHWKRLALGRPTVAFAVNVEHSKHIAEQFAAAGIRVRHVDASTPDTERERTWVELARGDLDVVASVGLISYGWDQPAVSCAILARPTKSLPLYLQQVGRVRRGHTGKTDCLILDHAGCVLEHGWPDEDREWSLEGKKRTKKNQQDRALNIRMCLQCYRAFPSTVDICPECGWQYIGRAKPPEVVAGELQELTRGIACRWCGTLNTSSDSGWPVCRQCGERVRNHPIRKLSDDPDVAALQRIAEERDYRPGWIWHKIQERKVKRGHAPENHLKTAGELFQCR